MQYVELNPYWNVPYSIATQELLPVISFNAKASADEAKKHEDFVTRMVAKGYTAKQVRLLCEWYLRVRKSS